MKPGSILAISMLFGPLVFLTSCRRAHPVEAAPAPLSSSRPNGSRQIATEPVLSSLDGTYSDMKHIEGEGDVLGIEITISHSQRAPIVTFICSQGELPQPQGLAAELSGNALHFRSHDNDQCPGATYTAVVTGETVTLTRDGTSTPPELLQRVSAPGERPHR